MESTIFSKTGKNVINEEVLTYYRLTRYSVDFLNKIQKEFEIVGIELEKNEDGGTGFNVGLILKSKLLSKEQNGK